MAKPVISSRIGTNQPSAVNVAVFSGTNILRQYCRPETLIVETPEALSHITICFYCKSIFGTVFVIYMRKWLNGKHKIYQAGDQQWIRFHGNQSYEKGLNKWLFWDWDLRSQPGSRQ